MKKEIKRYLGCSKAQDERIDDMIDKALDLIEKTAKPKYTYKVFDIKTDENGVYIADRYFKSRDLATNLRRYKRAAMIAITLGIEVDRLIERTAITDIALASVLQATAAAYIEERIDELELEIVAETDGATAVAPRFSAGYGDLSISYQRDFASVLDTFRIGLTVSETMQLIPTKSVTAVIGIKED